MATLSVEKLIKLSSLEDTQPKKIKFSYILSATALRSVKESAVVFATYNQ